MAMLDPPRRAGFDSQEESTFFLFLVGQRAGLIPTPEQLFALFS